MSFRLTTTTAVFRCADQYSRKIALTQTFMCLSSRSRSIPCPSYFLCESRPFCNHPSGGGTSPRHFSSRPSSSVGASVTSADSNHSSSSVVASVTSAERPPSVGASKASAEEPVTKVDFRKFSPDQILVMAEIKSDVTVLVSAWFNFGLKMQQLSPQERYNYRLPTRRIGKLLARLQPSLPTLDFLQLNALWLGCRDLKLADPIFPMFLQDLERATIQKASDFKPKELSNTLNAMIRVNADYVPSETVLKALCDQSVQETLMFTAQHIATILHALGKVGFYPGSVFLHKMSEKAAQQSSHFEAQHIGMFLFAFTELNCKPSESVVRTLCLNAEKRAHFFSPQHIAKLLDALAKLNFHPGDALLDSMCTQAVNRAGIFKAHEIANMLNALATLNFYPAEPFFEGYGQSHYPESKVFRGRRYLRLFACDGQAGLQPR
eukprot:gb/GEZN01004892.1/.p1 GENE.gb/GEZN01004892.1/~~gb/GEZN01004892.1/.p1  ORF type:complete len:435 (+),score=39.30 gb/GEZN01004892.1/:39-1343(+)